MKYLVLFLLAAMLLWIASIAWANRRKPATKRYDSNRGSDSGGGSGDSCSSSYGSSDSCCGGDGGGD